MPENSTVFNKHFKNFYLLYAGDLIFFARKFVDYQTAEDIVHDLFLKIWDSKSTIIIEVNIKNYLLTMVQNSCIDNLKRKKVADNFVEKTLFQLKIDELMYYSSINDANLEESKFIENVYATIEKLPYKRRVVFEKAYLEDQKHSDIAEELKISTRTVETHIYKALKFLRENLKLNLYYNK